MNTSNFNRKTKSLSKEVKSRLQPLQPFKTVQSKIVYDIKKGEIKTAIGFLAFLFLVISLFAIQGANFFPSIIINKEHAVIILEKRIANIVTIFSISIVVLTFIIGLSEKQEFGKNAILLILEEILFFPILYFILSSILYLSSISFLQDHIPSNRFVNLVGTSFYILIIVIILIGYLFKNISRLINTNFLFTKRLERVTLYAKRITYNDAYHFLGLKILINQLRKSNDNTFSIIKKEYYLPPQKIVVDINLHRLEQFFKDFQRKYPDYYITVVPITLNTIPHIAILKTNKELSEKEMDSFNNIFSLKSPKKSSYSDESYLNEVSTINYFLQKYIEDGNARRIHQVFEFYQKQIDILAEYLASIDRIKNSNQNRLPIFSLVKFEIISSIYKTITYLNQYPSLQSEINQLVIDKIIEVLKKILFQLIDKNSFPLFRKNLYEVSLFNFPQNESQLINSFYQKLINLYASVFDKMNEKLSETDSMEKHKLLIWEICPSVFKILYRYSVSFFHNDIIFISCIQAIRHCEIDEEFKIRAFSASQKIQLFTEQTTIKELENEYDTYNLPYIWRGAILTILQAYLIQQYRFEQQSLESIQTRINHIQLNEYYTDINTILTTWSWIEKHWDEINENFYPLIPKNGLVFIFTILLLKVSVYIKDKSDIITKEAYALLKYEKQILQLSDKIGNDFDKWTFLLKPIKRKLYYVYKENLSLFINKIKSKRDAEQSKNIRESALSSNMIEKYIKNVKKGYYKSYEYEAILFQLEEQSKKIEYKNQISSPIHIEKKEDKQIFLNDLQQQKWGGLDYFYHGNVVGQDLAKKELEAFLNLALKHQVLSKNKIQESSITVAIKQIISKDFNPNIILSNKNLTELFKKYEKRFGHTTFFGKHPSGIRDIIVQTTAFPSFVLIADFNEAFQKIGFKSSEQTYINIDIKKNNLKVFKDSNHEHILKAVNQKKPVFYNEEYSKENSLSALAQLSLSMENWIDKLAAFHLEKENIFEDTATELFLKKSPKIGVSAELNVQFRIKNEDAFVMLIEI